MPIDFSKPSEKALDYALPFARQFGAQIVVLHVAEPRNYPNSFIMPPEIIEGNTARMDAREEKLSEFSRKRIGRGIKTATVVQLGKPYQEIVKLAEARRVDLIILATHGHSGVERLFLGSTAERVVRHAPCPVLVVREKEREFVLSGEISEQVTKPTFNEASCQKNGNGEAAAWRLRRSQRRFGPGSRVNK